MSGRAVDIPGSVLHRDCFCNTSTFWHGDCIYPSFILKAFVSGKAGEEKGSSCVWQVCQFSVHVAFASGQANKDKGSLCVWQGASTSQVASCTGIVFGIPPHFGTVAGSTLLSS